MNEVILITILFLVAVSILVTLYRKQEERAVFRINELSASVTELSNRLKAFEGKFDNYTDSFDQLLRLKVDLLFDQNSNMEKQITGNLKAIKSSLEEQLNTISEGNIKYFDEMSEQAAENKKKI